ncbi:hypothetical protein NAC44_19250 [Allorhizobium sp. BGMRC 0089]|nr:hypothetical protein [Allorhizobium sonneratiae]
MAALLYDRARQEFMAGAYQDASATIARLLEVSPKDGDTLLLAASIAERLGDALLAARYYERSLGQLALPVRKQAGFRAASHYLDGAEPDRALAVLLVLHKDFSADCDVNHSICSLYREAGRYPDALAYAQTLARVGRDFENWLNAGMVLLGAGKVEEAYAPLRKAYDAKPDERLALTELFWCAISLCDFPLADRLQGELVAAYERDGERLDIRENVFRSLQWCSDEAYHVLSALNTAANLNVPVKPRPSYRRDVSRRLRIGYVSSDYCEHATLALMAGVFEHHDRSRFEVFGICHTRAKDRGGRLRQRFLNAVEHFVDIVDLDDDQAAAAIRALDLDILIDLKGFTFDNRLGIFCRRPAPIQVSYLGFPGSVAGVGIDYAITDAIVTPPSSEPFYAEKLIRLPGSYQCNDGTREAVMRQGLRATHGLPEKGMVFAAFNQAVKIRSAVFAAWMDILTAVEGSVLWLIEMNETTRSNLRAAASRAGVDPGRLIFARKTSIPEHLHRLTHADIALDTSPYNGHTTTADALWAGVPVITFKGESFAARVAESLLNAVGLPELVADTLDQYRLMAVALAQDGVRQSRLRQHLLDARKTAPLFDTARFTRDFESALETIAADAAARG